MPSHYPRMSPLGIGLVCGLKLIPSQSSSIVLDNWITSGALGVVAARLIELACIMKWEIRYGGHPRKISKIYGPLQFTTCQGLRGWWVTESSFRLTVFDIPTRVVIYRGERTHNITEVIRFSNILESPSMILDAAVKVVMLSVMACLKISHWILKFTDRDVDNPDNKSPAKLTRTMSYSK